MNRKLVPRAPIWLWIAAEAPWPMATIATTQPTPMITPSIVSSVRIGLRRSATTRPCRSAAGSASSPHQSPARPRHAGEAAGVLALRGRQRRRRSCRLRSGRLCDLDELPVGETGHELDGGRGARRASPAQGRRAPCEPRSASRPVAGPALAGPALGRPLLRVRRLPAIPGCSCPAARGGTAAPTPGPAGRSRPWPTWIRTSAVMPGQQRQVGVADLDDHRVGHDVVGDLGREPDLRDLAEELAFREGVDREPDRLADLDLADVRLVDVAGRAASGSGPRRS